MSTERPIDGKRAKELNELIRYTMWSVFKVCDRLPADGREAATTDLDELLEQLDGKGVVTRGLYDVSGFRADADFMIWWVAETSDALQDAWSRFRASTLGRACEPVWSAMALHRPAEFNKSHVPAYIAGEDPKKYVSVYPFNRDYEWYLLPDEERRGMLAEHGKMAREYADVRANTVQAFALGDYEWILAFEADELHRIVDLMRDLRAATARRHTRLEIPFYPGARKSAADLIAALP
jgi:chlorite dismutase